MISKVSGALLVAGLLAAGTGHAAVVLPGSLPAGPPLNALGETRPTSQWLAQQRQLTTGVSDAYLRTGQWQPVVYRQSTVASAAVSLAAGDFDDRHRVDLHANGATGSLATVKAAEQGLVALMAFGVLGLLSPGGGRPLRRRKK